MKRCPQCGRDYTDETLNFCLEDGKWLLSVDEPVTAILAEAELPSESPTRRLIPSDTNASTSASSKRRWIIGAMVCLAATVALGVGGYLYYLRGNARQIDSIAVMPFVNESGNADLEFLTDGMTETLINSLMQLPNVKVQARSSVFRYKGTETSAPVIGRLSSIKVDPLLDPLRDDPRFQELLKKVGFPE